MGLALYTFAPIICHILTILMMACAIPDDIAHNSEPMNDHGTTHVPLAVVIISAVLLLVSYSLIYYGFSSIEFSWAGFFKTDFLILAAIAAGRCVGGIVSDKLGRLFNVCAGAIGGSFIIVFCADNKKLSLIGLLLLSMPLCSIITALTKRSPGNSGFIFALFCSVAYLGQELTFYLPMKRPIILTLIAVGAVLAVAASETPDIVAFFKKLKERKK